MVVQACGKTEDGSICLAPFIDQRGKDFSGPDLSAEPGQFVEQVVLREVAPGEFRVQTAEKQFPPERSKGGDLHEGVVAAEVSKWVRLKPVLALLGPVGAGAALFGRGYLALELMAAGG